MHQAYARALGGQRIKMPVPFNRGTKYSLIGAITYNKVLAAMYGEWATNGEIFNEFLENYLCPKLKPYHKVVLDNVSFHKTESARKNIEKTGAQVIFLPPYSPELTPIENMWSKVKIILRKLAARSPKDFHNAISVAFKSISKNNLLAWFQHCGYLVDQ